MAEGMTGMNQQVVDNGHWSISKRLTADEHCPGSDRPAFSEREAAKLRASLTVDQVLRAVEAEIVPRVVMARHRRQGAEGPMPRKAPAQTEIETFSRILLAHGDEAAAMRFIEGVRGRGLPLEDVFLELFQPAARFVGALWDADLCSFVDVTLALGLLQRLLREFSPAFQIEARRIDAVRQALLVPLPGDQHTFGLSMVAEFFRRSAWSVWSVPFGSSDDLGLAMRDTWFTVVGFSVSCAARLDELAAVIKIVRLNSCNGAVGVLVGGPVFIDHPDFVARVGADGIGLDARDAVFKAECFAAQTPGQ